MKERQDYRGEFDVNLKLEDFSKEALIRLMNQWGKLYLLLGGTWSDLMTDKFGLEKAVEWETEVWVKMGQYEMRYTGDKALKVDRDLKGFIKTMRFTPGGFLPASFDWDVEFLSENEAVLKITKCYAVEVFEAQGRESKIDFACNTLEKTAIPAWCAAWSPNLKCEALKTPPRKTKCGSFCEWKFTMEPSK